MLKLRALVPVVAQLLQTRRIILSPRTASLRALALALAPRRLIFQNFTCPKFLSSLFQF